MSDITRFAEYYRDQYGDDIHNLLAALSSYDEKIAIINPFLSPDDLKEILIHGRKESLANFTFWTLPKDLKPRAIQGLMSHYFLDRSSLLAPLLLPIYPGMKVLDMCAAPGGKLLVMLNRLLPEVTFVANDISRSRVERLRKVLNHYVPASIGAHIRVSNYDASFFALRTPRQFDAVLLDAPCSSEQHVIKNPKKLSESKGLRKTLVHRQYSLLCSALLALKSGGHIMYATCSINKNENEGVIKKLLKKKGDLCSVVSIASPLGESNEYGTTILPHLHQNGPAFIALIKRF